LTSLGMRKGSFLQGESWSRIIVRLFPILNSKNGSLAKETKHFLPLYCESLFNLGHTIQDANSLLFYIFVRDQISAAVRLGICGPLEGQVIQAQLLEMQTKVLKTASLPEPPIKTAARWEVCQSIHSRVYSTLFQN
jgi:urease accessory protein